jgi:hypothetical protein
MLANLKIHSLAEHASHGLDRQAAGFIPGKPGSIMLAFRGPAKASNGHTHGDTRARHSTTRQNFNAARAPLRILEGFERITLSRACQDPA